MTDPDFAGFLTLLYCQFPSLREWLYANSPDPNRTQQMWARTLSPYSLAECQTVLAQWAELPESPLKAYSRDAVAQLIRHTAGRNREAHHREQQRQRTEAESQQYVDSQGRTIASNMTSTLDRLLRYRSEVTQGKLDPSDAELFIDKALREVV